LINQTIPQQPAGGQTVPNPQGQPEENAQNPNIQPGAIQMNQEQFDMIQQLVSSPEFQAIRQQAQANPQIIPQLLQFLQQSNPQLFQLLSQNPNLLAALLLGQAEFGEEGLEGHEGHGDAEDGGEMTMDFTEEDYAAIEMVR